MAPMFTMGLMWPLSSDCSLALMASKGLPVASMPTRLRTSSSPLSRSACSSKMGLMTLWMVKGWRQSPAQFSLPLAPIT